ncbi:EmrB/QacA subfamily drug resistance transporter [Leucobacter exalbidus]|uniref:EmrB/QacA subfamily drug resistance transporter n=1 Tax=Leucobacter exalbidus TaxID=662960 RepID=A0A940PMC1_9MICO|nr:MFS transporter [Leucobacter exalbidus]MBP1325763.1 EmrB/QacA subfamily drug resistance transporter [Leucobacter exalbidus]
MTLTHAPAPESGPIEIPDSAATTPTTAKPAGVSHTAHARRWWALVIIAMTQLVVVLDGTIINIALPSAQIELGLSNTERQWVVTSYVLVFGALLLLGGRIADTWGRKRSFMLGMIGFGAVSLYGGLAQNALDLLLARGLQGLFAALLAPAALALLTVAFPFGRERNIAFAVFGAVAGSGAAVGLLLGGFLTEYTSWRWCLLVNIVFVLIGVIVGAFVLSESKSEGKARLDIWGAITVTLGLGALVYGFTLAEEGWMHVDTIGFLVLGVILLAVFVLIETKVAHPLLPMRVVMHSVRAGAYFVQAVMGAVLIGSTMYLAFHLQLVLGMSPLLAGLASVVMTVITILVVPMVTKLLPVTGPRPMMVFGPFIAAVGMFWMTFITADGSYVVQVMPGLILVGLGVGVTLVPLQNLALVGVAPSDAGSASAMVNVAMQIGGSIGLSVFALAAASASLTAAENGAGDLAVQASGYSAVFLSAGIALVLAGIVSVFCVRGKKEDLLPSHG